MWVSSIAPTALPKALTSPNLLSQDLIDATCSDTRHAARGPHHQRQGARRIRDLRPVPTRINVGKVTRVPPPATAFIAPATIAAARQFNNT